MRRNEYSSQFASFRRNEYMVKDILQRGLSK